MLFRDCAEINIDLVIKYKYANKYMTIQYKYYKKK